MLGKSVLLVHCYVPLSLPHATCSLLINPHTRPLLLFSRISSMPICILRLAPSTCPHLLAPVYLPPLLANRHSPNSSSTNAVSHFDCPVEIVRLHCCSQSIHRFVGPFNYFIDRFELDYLLHWSENLQPQNRITAKSSNPSQCETLN